MKLTATLTRITSIFAFAMLLPCASIANADVVAQWQFDESSGSVASDSIGSVDGTLFGDASFVAGGISGNALSVTVGGNGFVDMGNNFGFTDGNFSVVSWIKMQPGDENSDYFIISKHRSTQVAGYFLNVNSTGGYGATSKAFFYESNPSGGPNPGSSTSVNDGGWHQVVGVYHDGGLAEIFVNGVLEDSAASHNMGGISQSLLVGGLNSAAGNPFGTFTGLIDEVQLHDEALTPQEVLYLFNNPTATAIPEPGSSLLLLGIGTLWIRRKRS